MKEEYFEIVNDPNVKTSEMMDKFKKKFDVYCYFDDLDKNFLPPPAKTTRYFKKQQDPDYLNKSHNDLISEKKEFMSFREYLIAFEKYYDETGKYLDKKGWTIFSDGLPGGDVAGGFWSPDSEQVLFGWHNPHYCDPYMGARLCIDTGTMISSNNEGNKDKQRFCLTCEQCGLQKYI